MQALALLVLFLAFAGLMLKQKIPAMLALPAMAVGVALIVGTNLTTILKTVVSDGAIHLSPAYAAVVFGAMLGQVTVQTGIAESIIKHAAEFSGDKPLWIVVALSSVTALLFTTLTGLGAFIMVGSLVLPILVSAGISRPFAASVFLMAYGLGFIFNIGLWQYFSQVLGVPSSMIQHFALRLFICYLVVFAIFLRVHLRSESQVFYCASGTASPTVPSKKVPAVSFVTPLVPLLLHLVLNWPVIPSFLAGSFFGILTTRWKSLFRLLVSSAVKGLEEVAPSVLLMIGIGMLLKAVTLPQAVQALAPALAKITPTQPLAYVLFFTLLSPLVLYRGPLNIWGIGAGVFAVLLSNRMIPQMALAAAMLSLSQIQNVSEPTNTHNVWIANYLGVRVETLTRLTIVYMIVIAAAGLIWAAAIYFPKGS